MEGKCSVEGGTGGYEYTEYVFGGRKFAVQDRPELSGGTTGVYVLTDPARPEVSPRFILTVRGTKYIRYFAEGYVKSTTLESAVLNTIGMIFERESEVKRNEDDRLRPKSGPIVRNI